ncbi:ubiquitin carboxyl-terminal hydrolase, partial [Mortierella sp. AD094]
LTRRRNQDDRVAAPEVGRNLTSRWKLRMGPTRLYVKVTTIYLIKCSFAYLFLYRRHVRPTHKIYICGSGDCTQEYDTVEELQNHVKSTPGHHYLVCPDPVCSEIFFTKQSLIKHGALVHPTLPPPPEPIPGNDGVYKFVTNYIEPQKSPYESTPITVELAFKMGPNVHVVDHGIMDGDTPLLPLCFRDGSKLPNCAVHNFLKLVAAQGVIHSTFKERYCTICKKRLDWTNSKLTLNEDLRRLRQDITVLFCLQCYHSQSRKKLNVGITATFGTSNVDELVVSLKKTVPECSICRYCGQNITEENPHWILDKNDGVILSGICKPCVVKQKREGHDQRLQTLDGYRKTWIRNHGEHFSSKAVAQGFINVILVQQWSFGCLGFTEEEYLKVLQDVDIANTTCMFHHVSLYPGHKDVRLIISVDRTQFHWIEHKSTGARREGKWHAYDYSDPRQLSVLASLAENCMQGPRPLLQRLHFIVWLAESFGEGQHRAAKKRETWKLLLPYLDRILELEEKLPIRSDIRHTFNQRRSSAKQRKKLFTWSIHEFQFIIDFSNGRSWITNACLDGSIETGHMDRHFDDDGYEARNVMFIEAGLNYVKYKMNFKKRTTQDRKASIDLVAKELTDFVDWWIDSMVPEAFLRVFELHKKRHGNPPPPSYAQPLTLSPGEGGQNKPEDDLSSGDKVVPYVDVDNEVELRCLVEKLRNIQTERKMARAMEKTKDRTPMTIFDIDTESLPTSARTVIEQEKLAASSKGRETGDFDKYLSQRSMDLNDPADIVPSIKATVEHERPSSTAKNTNECVTESNAGKSHLRRSKVALCPSSNDTLESPRPTSSAAEENLINTMPFTRRTNPDRVKCLNLVKILYKEDGGDIADDDQAWSDSHSKKNDGRVEEKARLVESIETSDDSDFEPMPRMKTRTLQGKNPTKSDMNPSSTLTHNLIAKEGKLLFVPIVRKRDVERRGSVVRMKEGSPVVSALADNKTVQARGSADHALLKNTTLSHGDSASSLDDSYMNGICGLHNLGRTCYMNAALQCLANTPELTSYFLDGHWKQEVNVENPSGRKGEVASSYANLLLEMWRGRKKSMIDKLAPMFKDQQEQDAEEFLTLFLDGLHEDLKRIITKSNTDIPDCNNSVVDDLFFGAETSTLAVVRVDPLLVWSAPIVQNRIIAVKYVPGEPEKAIVEIRLQCSKGSTIQDLKGRVSSLVQSHVDRLFITNVSYDPYKDTDVMDDILDSIELFIIEGPPSDGQHVSRRLLQQKASFALSGSRAQTIIDNIRLEDCLQEYGKEEDLSEEHQWFCPRCRKLQQASKHIQICRYPDVLVIQLKRFINAQEKVEALVDFPIHGLSLSGMSPLVEEKDGPTYDLFGVTNHIGGLDGGHYTAHVKNERLGTWHLFDDSVVSPILDEEKIKTSSAYLLFYHKR